MAPSELIFLSAASMRDQIRQKALSPVELLNAHLQQIERVNPKLNDFIHVDAEGASRAAHDAEAKLMRGEQCGLLHGVPISIKSSIAVEGMPFEAGTKLRAGCVAEQDAVLVQRLRAEGAIILGVTNTPE